MYIHVTVHYACVLVTYVLGILNFLLNWSYSSALFTLKAQVYHKRLIIVRVIIVIIY